MRIDVKNYKATLILVFLLISFISCDNEHQYGFKPDAVKTLEVTDVSQTSSIVSGNIISDGGRSISERGICWNTSINPTIANFKRANQTASLGIYNCSLDNLLANTVYYARAYATNSSGTAYGETVTFTTLPATLAVLSSTTIATSITQNTANSGGVISNDGAATITSRGVCWRTTPNPTIGDAKTINGTGIGTFTSSINSLMPNTTYYVRAYATNSVGTSYANQISFTTLALAIPTITATTAVTSITQNSSISGGTITSDGGAPVTVRGVCWSNSNSNPTISNNTSNNGNGIGTYSSTLTGLMPGTTYYVRAYATNSVGTSYGIVRIFNTLSATAPTGVSTTSLSSISQNTATGGGNVNSDGGSPITSRGVCWNTTSFPTISNSKTIDGTGVGSFTSALTNLVAGTTYYVRAYATNSLGTTYGTTRTFTTLSATLPSGVVTTPISLITQNTASSGGTIASSGGANITTKGVCWSNTNSSPTISNNNTNNGTGINTYSSSLTGLTANTTYYVRAYAINSVGITYGNVLVFTTLPNLTVGQSYQGGIIAYIFVAGDNGYIAGQTHGLIATTTNQSTGSQWGCSGTSIAGTSTVLGTGLANTSAIVSGCGSTTNAAAICNNFSSSGYTDWYLPSRDELSKLYLNRTAIGGFNNLSYWSSSQTNATTANSINFNTGIVSSTSLKTTSMYVRAIRKF